ncbi:peptide chain release factor N(5)-glutamine methyltransferase [Flavobacterium sp.]|uniref:peptide chain release factor N(5)-glutamine methyltransferase n=1 Tax=Flavobacterium sp. TaxID=239 RepID=UPI0025C614C8|nr:peptide chain release factor N(5)-glutamine methyltransferase [Flavobacterium sp.]MBA4153290.1 peptide chain release factor N(5)-glutamine methyltransferase [Flavobacterium sp.]
MEVKKYRSLFQNELSPFFDTMEIDQFFYLTLEKRHQLKRVDLALNPNFEITVEEEQYWDSVLTQLKTQKPIQYILGETSFYGLTFLVNEHTLIPRSETEELVQWILETNPTSSEIALLDIGTGTGCIPITLKKNLPKATVFALDVSEKALEVATKNASMNQVEITFLQNDILATSRLEQQFDIIVSNPPYVRELEKNEINTNVLQFEPHLALFVADNDALLFYRKIAELAQVYLQPNGQLFFEINQYLGTEMVALVASYGFTEIELRQDIYGNDRMLRAVKSF